MFTHVKSLVLVEWKKKKKKSLQLAMLPDLTQRWVGQGFSMENHTDMVNEPIIYHPKYWADIKQYPKRREIQLLYVWNGD